MQEKITDGNWDVACDSYGKVRHSRKACVFTNVSMPNGDQLVAIACRIPNWSDARLISAAPELLHALKQFDPGEAIHITHNKDVSCAICKARRAIAKAEGR